MTRKILIARLGDAYGIQGWLHLFSYASPPENFFNYSNFLTDSDQKKLVIVSHKPHGNHFVVKIKGCSDRDQALLIKNQAIYIDRSVLPPLPENEFYWDDLFGLSVFSTQNKKIGTVDHLFSTGSNDVMAVKGEKLVYIPYLPEVILSVDLDKKTIIVDWQTE